MKTKALYIYGGAIIIILAAIIIINSVNSAPAETSAALNEKQMPQDEVHNPHSLQGGENPSGSNVKPDFMARYNELKEYYAGNPNDTAKAKEFAGMLAMAHRKDQAIEIYKKILESDKNRVDILLALGFEYFEVKDFDKAYEMTQRVVELQKNNTEALYNLGAIANAKGQVDKAKEIWTDIINKYPGSEAAGVAKSSLEKLK